MSSSMMPTTSIQDPCPEYLIVDLRMQIAEIVFAVLGIIGCICVFLVLYGFNKDRRSLSDRILFGLFIANFVFSVANIAQPISAMHKGTGYGEGCWAQVYKLPYRSLNATLSFWIGTKFAVVCYEIFLVAASLVSLQSGSINIRKRWEVLSHVTCWGVSIAIMIAIGVHYEEETADFVGIDQGRNMIDIVMVFWSTLLAIVFVLWICQRLYLASLMHAWKHSLKSARLQWDREFWNLDAYNLAMRERRQRLLEKQRESYLELTLPLQGYIIVFLLFAPVTIVINTSYCEQKSIYIDGDIDDVDCDDACLMMLGLRTIVTVAVYFFPKEHRLELYNFQVLCQKVWSRFSASINDLYLSCLMFCGTSGNIIDRKRTDTIANTRVRFRHPSNLEQVRYFDQPGNDTGSIQSSFGFTSDPPGLSPTLLSSTTTDNDDGYLDPTNINPDRFSTISSASGGSDGSRLSLFGVPSMAPNEPASPPPESSSSTMTYHGDGIEAMLLAPDNFDS